MALLTGGQRLGLASTSSSDLITNSSSNNSSQKSVVFVKLTDAAFAAIAKYVQRQNKQRAIPSSNKLRKPTIQFCENTGAISIPEVDSLSDDESRTATYNFRISSTDDQNGPQGSFECLDCKSRGHVEAVGHIQNKLVVSAAADTYQRFGEKIHEAKRESGKRSTVLLERGGGTSRGFGNKAVYRKPYRHPSALAPRSSSSASSFGHQQQATSFSRNEERFVGHNLPSQTSSSGTSSLSTNHPMLDRHSSSKANSPSSKPTTNPDIMKRPLRQRIAHLLAVRPYKKPELLCRIKRDGLLEKDRNNVFNIARQITAHSKDNTYRLARHMWNDVSEDWPFYTEEERQAFKRSKPQNLTPPGSDGSSSSIGSGLSSSSSRPSSPQAIQVPTSRKRNGHGSCYYGESEGASAGKKKRVSNYVRPQGMQYGSDGGGRSPLMTSGRSPGSSLAFSRHENSRSPYSKEPKSHQDYSTGDRKTGSWHIGDSQKQVLNVTNNFPEHSITSNRAHKRTLSSSSSASYKSPIGMDDCESPSASPDSLSLVSSQVNVENENPKNGALSSHSPRETNDNESSMQREDVVPSDELPDRIESKEQRKAYKEMFNKDYTEYRRLHGMMKKVSLKFAGLKNQLSEKQEGSSSYKEIEARIFKEYQAMMTDPEYVRIREQFQQLHEKLTKMKRLVQEFDDKFYGLSGKKFRKSSSGNYVNRIDMMSPTSHV